jgi:16S rRNA (cytidine1402-2'-O)-methyltransferase
MSGTLYVVATPIGNLEDITLRAVRVLREVSVIAAEDTRRTAKLLHHFGITTRTTSFHEHNTSRRMPELLGRLRSGESVALVSDAGTPLLSDPGLELIRECIAAGVAIEPVPGPSAPLAALVASGFPAEPLTILGFAPSRAIDRKAWFVALEDLAHTVVFFETPHRIQASLKAAAGILGDRPLFVARELTKLHQEFLRGRAIELVERLSSPRGEFTVVVGPKLQIPVNTGHCIDMQRLASEFRHLTDSVSLTRRQAISELARRYGRPAREIYTTLEHAKGRTLP